MSGLRCWPGAMAVIVRSANRNEGRTVECVSLTHGSGELGTGPRWVTDPPVFDRWGRVRPVLDSCLRPITPPPGTDCTTHEADKPQPVEA